MWFAAIPLVVMVGALVWLPYAVSDTVNVFVRGLFGAEVIHVRRWDGLYWKAILHRDPWGELFTYRYPATRTGFVSLNADGTGCYTGGVKWMRASEVKQL